MNWAHSSLNPPILRHRVHTQQRPAQPGLPTRNPTRNAHRPPTAASSAGEAALCLLPAAPWALGHTQPRMPPHRPTFDQPSRITKLASREGRERPSPQTAGEGPFPGGGRPPQHPTRHHQGEQPAIAQQPAGARPPHSLRKTDTPMAGSTHPGWRRQWCRPCDQVQSRFCACVQIGVWAGAGPVLTPVRRLRHRQCHFSAGATEGKFAHRASQNHAQAQSSAKSTPTPRNRSAPPTTGRPCASPSPSLRSTSASAWAALSPPRRARSRHPGKAGKGPLPKTAGEGPFPGGGRPPQHHTRHHEGEWPASVQSRQRTPRMAPALVPAM